MFKMVAFSEEKLIRFLKQLNGSRSKIINLSSWLLYYKKHFKVIVEIWFVQFLKAQDQHKVTLLYLVNEIVQHGKKCPEYVREFEKILPKAFHHLSKLNTYEEILDKDVIKLLKIWSVRRVFSPKQIMSFSKVLDSSISKYGMVNHGIALNDINFEDVNELITMSPHSFVRDVQTEEEALIERINLLQDPPTLDHRVRAEISKIPSEIFDLETLKDVKSKQSAYDLANRVEYALQVTSDYNSRLMQEVEHRKKLNLQLNDFTNAQKEIIDQGKERLKKYRMKLIRIKRLQRQLISYVEMLPEWQDIKELSSVPSNGNLFE